tara:strand:- start:55 stop:303 length:249 start_codon:yes stop_codon:yes gene_type:complete
VSPKVSEQQTKFFTLEHVGRRLTSEGVGGATGVTGAGGAGGATAAGAAAHMAVTRDISEQIFVTVFSSLPSLLSLPSLPSLL